MEDLIRKWKGLLAPDNFNEQKMRVLEIQTKRILKEQYDTEIAEEFGHTVSPALYFTVGMDEFRDIYKPAIQNGINFLESLHSTELPQAAKEAPAAPTSPQSMTISGGTVIFGDNAKVNNITVGDIIAALEQEIEQNTPDGEEKSKALSAIKNLTANETFAAVVGQTLGAFLSHSIK